MKKKTLKRTLWIAGLALVLLLPLTVIPGINYELEGPWSTLLVKSSEAYNNSFTFSSPVGVVGYSWWPDWTSDSYIRPEGLSLSTTMLYFRAGSFEVFAHLHLPQTR